jgi:hypothetical protein
MDDAAKSAQGISFTPIVIKIFCNDGYNLSLIDMPGLTKIALKD